MPNDSRSPPDVAARAFVENLIDSAIDGLVALAQASSDHPADGQVDQAIKTNILHLAVLLVVREKLAARAV